VLVAQRHVAIVRAPTPNAPVGETAGSPVAQSASDALGLAVEVVAPLGSGGDHDALLAIGSLDRGRQYEDADLATVEVLAALVEARRAVRELTRGEARLRRQIEDGALAGRELAHRLNNDLTMPVGVVELLLDRGPLGPDLQEMLVAASKDLAALEQHIRDFHDLMRSQSTAPAGPRPPER
jgi:signal transduction histidine kinase